MKRTKKVFSVLLAVLLFASLFACARVVPQTPAPSGKIDAPVYTLEPIDSPVPVASNDPVRPDDTPEPTAAPTEKPTPEPTAAPTEQPTPEPTAAPTDTPCPVSEDGEYWTKDEVALYIHLFGRLPKNYISKSKAQDLGWPGYGSLEPYAPGYSIGGDYFGNYEKLLPKKKGRKYTECDIDTRGKRNRGDKRIVFSNDGLIYYTDDHYNSFTLLYGEE